MQIRQLITPSIQQQSYAFLIIATVIFACCLIGIFTRPITFLALLWPANPVLLGLFLRFPKLNNFGGWLGAIIAYAIADLITGNSIELTLYLTISNLISVSIPLILVHFTKLNYRDYNKGLSFLYLFAMCTLGGCLLSAIFAVQTITHVPNSFMSPERFWTEFGMWWTGEVFNFVTFLPLILTFPTRKESQQWIFELFTEPLKTSDILPFIAIIISVAFTHIFFGPGSLLYPLAALIWAALSYRLFSVAFINSVVCIVTYHSLTYFYLSSSSNAFLSTTISIRIGLCMLGIAPLILCAISQNRQKLYRQVLDYANHDSLTNTLNRRYFLEQSQLFIQELQNKSVSILMIDIDHFKQMNDRYGHHVGDLVLQQFAKLVKQKIGFDDLFARIGGEEFTVLTLNTSLEDTIQLAERIHHTIETAILNIENQFQIQMTISIGIAHQALPLSGTLQQLIVRADQALYSAKAQGRNQIIISTK